MKGSNPQEKMGSRCVRIKMTLLLYMHGPHSLSLPTHIVTYNLKAHSLESTCSRIVEYLGSREASLAH